jgi:hypothetical protein
LAHQTGRSAPALGKILRRAEGRLVVQWLSVEGSVPEGTLGATGSGREA